MVKGKEKEIDILQFIDKFKEYEKDNVLVKTFTEGFCYYFALILKSRFPEGKIYYYFPEHFVFKYQDRLYDITGDCTEMWNDQEALYDWEEFQKIEPSISKSTIRDCIELTEV